MKKAGAMNVNRFITLYELYMVERGACNLALLTSWCVQASMDMWLISNL